MKTGGNKHTGHDRGFTLVELLIVIVILGILATVTVFAVRGIADKGEDSAMASDERAMEHAQEAYLAMHGAYGTEADLVSGGLLREESSLHDISLTLGGSNYDVIAAGSGTATTVAVTPTTVAATPWVDGDVVTTTFAGFVAEQYGNGPEVAFLLGRVGDTQSDWSWFTSNSAPLAGWTIYNVTDPALDTSAELLAARSQADFTLYHFSETVAEGPVWQLLKAAQGGLWPAPANHAASYWSWRNAPGSSIADFANFLATERNDGAPVGYATTTSTGYSAWKSTDSTHSPVVVLVGDPSMRAGYETWLQAQTNLQYDQPILYVEDSDLDTLAEVNGLDITTSVTVYLPQTLYDLFMAAHPGGQNDVRLWRTSDLDFII